MIYYAATPKPGRFRPFPFFVFSFFVSDFVLRISYFASVDPRSLPEDTNPPIKRRIPTPLLLLCAFLLGAFV
jgi:hypothetical protein